MAHFKRAWWLLAIAGGVRTLAQSSISVSASTTMSSSTSATLTEVATPTGSYLSYSSQVTQDTTDLGSISSTGSASIRDNTTTTSTPGKQQSTSQSITYLTGSGSSTTKTSLSGTYVTTPSPSASPTGNTQPCNNYVEFCSRKYSNITEIACHNSPFVVSNNLAANQQYSVSTQLNDGVRFLQAQIQWPTNGTTPHFCHTSCDLLDAGPITDWLTEVKTWVATHPYDVVTILLGNGNYSVPSMYAPYIESTGILQYVYTPPLVPMNITNWPTLSEMILSGRRVVMFMDYMANQTEYPWLLDEFSQMWETPFDPTNQTFPCDVQRPPDLAHDDANGRLSLINHNLNIELTVLGTSLLVPARADLNTTNNITGYGSLGTAANTCVETWGRAPNFLNVDYYNAGGYPGTVFEVAAKLNNVTYNGQCCGMASSKNGASERLSIMSSSLVCAWITLLLLYIL
ncbi:PLC-like phosphodiesterase [Xylariaceae sp. FL0255]|nr:PLC-like phosphodiesterase [Xylariaceae sp. FL0255]